MADFSKFVADTLRAVQVRVREKFEPEAISEVSVNYDPKAERERFLKDVWNVQSHFWALIEDWKTYYLTMSTLLEKLFFPLDRHVRLVSVGSGPGLLYETFLAKYFDAHGIGGLITCIDFAPGMTAMQEFILSRESPTLRNIEAVNADMTNIPAPDRSVDAVLCNNALQWCTDWRKAIAEMGRILDPSRTPHAYLFVHLHGKPMHARTDRGECIIKMDTIRIAEIMDELEKNRFTIVSTRQLRSGKGGGQLGVSTMDRVFLKCDYTPSGVRHRWKSAKKTVAGAAIATFGKK